VPFTVRDAQIFDAPAIASIHLRAWEQLYSADLPAFVANLNKGDMTRTWGDAIAHASGGDSPYSVLVAESGTNRVVGFAAVSPLFDPDGGKGTAELMALYVDPDHQRLGHASRLLTAAADAARTRTHATRLSTWVAAIDYMRQRFLKQSGFGADGSERSWRTPEGDMVDEQRWSTLLE
jgi:GNAT superfamily N-acetyltransferase